MSETSPDHDRIAFLERLLRWQDGGLSEAEEAAFERELRDSPDRRRWFIAAQMDAMRIHAHLREEAYRRAETGAGSTTGIATRVGRSGKGAAAALDGRGLRGWIPWVLAASLAVAALWLALPRAVPVGVDVATVRIANAAPVATLVAVEEARWRDGAARAVGQRIPAGPLRLEGGSAVLRFDGGARLAVVAPADLILESVGSVRVRAGQVAVRATEEATGFRVWTPEGAAVDLGTEFVVSVAQSGAAECQVIEGEVEWHTHDGRRRLALLGAGEARRFQNGRMESVAAREAEGWRRLLDPAASAAPNGKLLAYEPFDYESEAAAAESLAGGLGWVSPWRGRFIPSDDVDLDPQMRLRPGASLSFPGLVAPQGGAFVFHEPKQWRLRLLPEPVDFGGDGVYYLSFLVRRPSQPPPLPPGSGRYSRVMLTLRSSANYWAHWTGFAITSANQPLILADGDNRVSPRTLPSGESLLMVCKLAASRRGPDQLFLRVYEPGETIEAEDPPRWTLTNLDLDYDIAFDLLVLSATGGVAWEVDELRFGTSWTAVLPSESAAVRNPSLR